MHEQNRGGETSDQPPLQFIDRRNKAHLSTVRTAIFHSQGSYGVLFCPLFLIRTLKTRNVILSPYKDSGLSFFF